MPLYYFDCVIAGQNVWGTSSSGQNSKILEYLNFGKQNSDSSIFFCYVSTNRYHYNDMAMLVCLPLCPPMNGIRQSDVRLEFTW